MKLRNTISARILETLEKGKKQLSKEALSRVSGFVESQRTEEHAFMDKSGKADLYYTAFGWILSYVLNIRLDSRKMTSYLAQWNTNELDLIHYAAYMRCRLIYRMMEEGKAGVLWHFLKATPIKSLETSRGYPHDDPHSPYTQFIWISLLEDTGNGIRNKSDIKNSLGRYHLPGGGYMNTRNGLTATTNATVAALAITGQLDGYKDNADIRFIYNLQEPSGGFSAAEASPIPDLLSTATSLFILKCYGIRPEYSAKDFIEAHWLDQGGFSATILEDKSDVEYTFYGLLALGAIYGPDIY